MLFNKKPVAPALTASNKSWSSAVALSMITWISGISDFTSRVARNPSHRGIATSIRMTSGCCSRASARHSSPSVAMPTTSMPCASKTLRRPSSISW